MEDRRSGASVLLFVQVFMLRGPRFVTASAMGRS